MSRSRITPRALCVCLMALCCWISGPVIMRPALVVIHQSQSAGQHQIHAGRFNKYDRFRTLCKLFMPVECEKSTSAGQDFSVGSLQQPDCFLYSRAAMAESGQQFSRICHAFPTTTPIGIASIILRI